MIELETIKNMESHPYVFGIRGEYLTQALITSILVLVFGLIGIGIFVFAKLYIIAALVLLFVIICLIMVLRYFIKISKVIPFKNLEIQADLITHINFEKLTNNGN